MSTISGAEAIVRCLEEEGVQTIFGYPGGAVIDLYDALMESDIENVLVRHEQGAVHSADAWSRTTGEVGVALLTSGPGATNGVTGIATAYMDSIPMVILTGQVPRHLIGNDAFQEVDTVGITRPCTKHNYLVAEKDDIPTVIREAFYLAKTGRPGPVLVDIPKDLMSQQLDFPEKMDIHMQSYQPTYEPNKRQIDKACKLICEAKKPVLYVGGGVILSDGSEELTELARSQNIPVTMTLMGLGAFPGKDELSLGMLGMHGTYTANMAVAESDLLIAVGARFDDRVTGKLEEFATKAKIIHVDIDPTSISKNVKVDVPIVSDCKKALAAINAWFSENGNIEEAQFASWRDQMSTWTKKHPLTYNKDCKSIKPQYVIEKLEELTGGDAIITTEVGQNQMWAAQFYRFNSPRHWVTSGGLGTMGFGLPAAIGAQMAFPDKIVVDVAGDGSIQMNIQELATAKQQGLPIKIVILNNSYLGMVRQWQELFYDKRYASTAMEVMPDFVALAEAYGAVGLRATKPEEVEPVLKEGLATPNIVIMDFIIEREEGVYPMVPAGKSNTEMLLV